MTQDEVINRLKSLGHVYMGHEQSLLEYIMKQTKERICNACNLTEIPEGLHCKAIDIACAEFLTVKLASGDVDTDSAVRTIHEGDTTITFAEGASTAEQYRAYLSKLGDMSGIVTYRRMKW